MAAAWAAEAKGEATVVKTVVKTAVETAVTETKAEMAHPRMYAYKNMSLAILRTFAHRCWLEWSQQYQSTSKNSAICFHNQILLLLLSNFARRPMYN